MMKAFRFLAVLVAMAVTDARGADPEVKRQAVDAEKAAKCVRAAVLKGQEVLGDDIIPPRGARMDTDRPALTDAQRDELRKRSELSSQIEYEGVRKCISGEDAYNIGWFSELAYVPEELAKCGLKRTPALRKHPEDDADSDLINGAGSWGMTPELRNLPAKDATPALLNKNPFFRGQNESSAHFEGRPLSEKCDALLAGYGPEGDRFPGLVEPICRHRDGGPCYRR